MYRAKQDGGDRYEIFDRHMEVQVTVQQERERELRDVLAKRDFDLLVSADLPACERQAGRASSRCSRRKMPTGAIDSFRDLLPVAEDTGLSISLGRDTHRIGVLADCWNGIDSMPGNRHVMRSEPDAAAVLSGGYGRAIEKDAGFDARIDPSRLLFEVSESDAQ